MFKIFKPIPIYIVLKSNHVKVQRLDTGKTISKTANPPFSNQRLVIADFHEAEHFIQNTIKELIKYKKIVPSFQVLIQQLDLNEGGLSSVEKRTLIDCANYNNAKEVYIIEEDKELSYNEAFEYLKMQN